MNRLIRKVVINSYSVMSLKRAAAPNTSLIRYKVTDTTTAPPPAVTKVEDAWVEVVDKQSGQIYYWNTETDETTALGEPKPTGPTAVQQPQQGSMLGGLGSVMAEGFAFGVGSSVAHGIVGSMFGGSDSGDSGSGGDDSYDI